MPKKEKYSVCSGTFEALHFFPAAATAAFVAVVVVAVDVFKTLMIR